jgi:hypothetical protein
MSQHKYACPSCGQHIEYTDSYSGMQIPCPRCQQPIVFPGIAGHKMTTTLHLVGRGPKPPARFQFTFAAIFLLLREFKHWKIVGVCLVPFVLLAGALVAASISSRHQTDAVALPTAPVVDPHALDKLTDLTRADQLVQERLAAVSKAFADCQAADQKQTEQHTHHRGPIAPTTFQAVDQAARRAHQALDSARKEFEAALAHYQKLGGTIDYRRQLP